MTLYDVIDSFQYLKTALVILRWLAVAFVGYVVVLLVGGASPVLANVFMYAIGFEWDFHERRWYWRFGRRGKAESEP